MGLYVETWIRTDRDTLWDRSQRPELHQRWDLRFGEITLLPSDGPDHPDHPDQVDRSERPGRFRYATRVLPGLVAAGTGICAGERRRPDGRGTSALRFGSPQWWVPLAEGSGYWRYVPESTGFRFLTGYDYRPRWGRLGRLVDRAVFRPLMWWATAWSFDRLRLWCERELTPERTRRRAVAEGAARVAAVVLAATLTGHVAATLLVALGAMLLPHLPGTPSARRCRFRPRLRRRPIAAAPAAPTSPAAPAAVRTEAT